MINARTDVYLAGVGEAGQRLSHAVARGNAYLQAGAYTSFTDQAISYADLNRLLARQRG